MKPFKFTQSLSSPHRTGRVSSDFLLPTPRELSTNQPTMESLVQPGFAIRRERQCLPGFEIDCGSTGVDGFRGCCPTSLVCDTKARNRYCCPPDDDSCTESALAAKPEPPCANATWDLFENGGYYCCEHGVQAYNRSDTNWCGKPSRSGAATMAVVTLSLLREGVGTYELLV